MNLRLRSLLYLLVCLCAAWPAASAPDPVVTPDNSGLRFSLSEVPSSTEPSTAPPPVKSTPLSQRRTAEILAPLPTLADLGFEEVRLPQRPVPPPRTGRTIVAPFPPAIALTASLPFSLPFIAKPPVRPTPAASQSLEIVRFSPEGDVPIADRLSITFSEPMVAITSQEALAAGKSPVQLIPQPPGQWLWAGTKTLLFEPKGRFPMATEYRVVVPAGTKSATGNRLARQKQWTFRTPPPSLQQSSPSDESVALDPPILLAFDQRIDRQKLVRLVQLRSGEKHWPLRLATPEEVQASGWSDTAFGKGRWVALHPVNLLPKATNFSVTLPGAQYSLEGSRLTAGIKTFGFRTYAPLHILTNSCIEDPACPPVDNFWIRFNNSLDGSEFNPDQVRVEPAIPGMEVSVGGNDLYISGRSQARTTYRFTVSGNLRDQFGQTLGKAQSVSITTAPAEMQLFTPGDNPVTLEPAGAKRFSFYSRNHRKLRVRLRAVKPEDWAYNTRWRFSHLPGRQVFEQILTPRAKDQLEEFSLDLRPVLKEGVGHGIVVVESLDREGSEINGASDPIVTWVQVTGLGLDTYSDPRSLRARVTALADGKPVSGATVSVGKQAALSDLDGVARFKAESNVLIARKGADSVFLQLNGEVTQGSTDRWYVFDDRKLYKPGERVHLKGWLRHLPFRTDGDLELPSADQTLTYRVIDSRGVKLREGKSRPNRLGGFDLAFGLPMNANLGSAYVNFRTVDRRGESTGPEFTHQFEIEAFRRPEYTVTTTASSGPHLIGGSAEVTATAAYYSGGGLPQTEVHWNVTASQTNYTPPNHADFTFGTWTPWWGGSSFGGPIGQPQNKDFTSRTDREGRHRLHIDFEAVNPARPTLVNATATVQDVNRQAISASTNVLVHPSSLYVGLRSERTFVQKGQLLEVHSLVTDIDGNVVPDRTVTMEAVRLARVFKDGTWTQENQNSQSCKVQSAEKATTCRFGTDESGTYQVRATVTDDQGRKNESLLTLWVAGAPPEPVLPQDQLTQDPIQLIPDQKDYRPGQTAEILVQSPFFPADGLLTLQHQGIVRQEHFRMDGPSTTLRIPIEENYLPNVYAQVDLVGSRLRTDDQGKVLKNLPERPAFASGQLNLSVSLLSRTLSVQAIPLQKTLLPGGKTAIEIAVNDREGRPMADSEVTVVVVDEAVLALTDYKLSDPLAAFYDLRFAGVMTLHSRDQVLLAQTALEFPPPVPPQPASPLARPSDGDVLDEVSVTSAMRSAPEKAYASRKILTASVPMATVSDALRRLVPGFFAPGSKRFGSPAVGNNTGPVLRTNFDPLALFAPTVRTDARGRARVEVKLPDNLTRYRVMAVAVAGAKQFGTAESNLTASLPLMVRPSAPRFLNFGDRFELPVVVQNQTGRPVSVDLALRGTGIRPIGEAGRAFTVRANDRAEIRFPMEAIRPGIALFQVRGVSDLANDAAEGEIPVQTPATTEAFATYGEIDRGARVQPVQAPPNVLPQVGGLEITTASTQLQSLTDAFIYIYKYPYGCAEQVSSRLLATVALKDVLAAFKTRDLPASSEIAGGIERDIQRLTELQNADGGWGFWSSSDPSWPYLSIHVAHGLQRAREKGFAIPSDTWDRARNYLHEIESHIPPEYDKQTRQSLIAYALYVRNRARDRDVARAKQLIARTGLGQLPLEAVGWLLPVLSREPTQVKAINRLLANRVTETAGTANFITSYDDRDYLLLNSERRTDGVLLDGLIEAQPRSDLIPKLVRGLLAHRVQGRWATTQENAFVLLALDHYFRTYEKQEPNFTARAWLGERFVGAFDFKGRSTDSYKLTLPMGTLARSAAPQNLTLAKEGPGRLYYRIGLDYAPASLKLKALNRGFILDRVYEGADHPQDVRRGADGTWQIKAGTRVRVRIKLIAPTRRYHVALVDPLPAGLEPLNPALRGTEPIGAVIRSPGANGEPYVQSNWFEHQNLRDAQAEAFRSLLPAGVYEYAYITRATTPGTFVVPPPKAEEMYQPEVFGRGATDRVLVR